LDKQCAYVWKGVIRAKSARKVPNLCQSKFSYVITSDKFESTGIFGSFAIAYRSFRIRESRGILVYLDITYSCKYVKYQGNRISALPLFNRLYTFLRMQANRQSQSTLEEFFKCSNLQFSRIFNKLYAQTRTRV